MAVNEKDILEFEEMFNLSTDEGSGGKDNENEQAEEYGHSTESSESFNKLTEEISENIENSKEKGIGLVKEDPHDIIKDICSKETPSTLKKEEIVEDDMFDDLSVKEKKETSHDLSVKDEKSHDASVKFIKEEKGKEAHYLFAKAAVKEAAVREMINEVIIEEIPSATNVDKVGYGDDKIEWMLDSPSAMYNSFYSKKRDLLFKYMVGGTIEYQRWMKELEEAKVIIKGEVFDHQLIINQMEEVQQHRERVKSIQIRVNNQYFTFKRFIEMMRGFLARIEYLKPVVRQEGLIMEHMRDVELYYARLESLHDSATKTEKVLAAAFDTLSRKCTICMELKPSERIDKTDKEISPISYASPSLREDSKEFDEFDDLPNNANVAPVGYKIGKIGWNEI